MLTVEPPVGDSIWFYDDGASLVTGTVITSYEDQTGTIQFLILNGNRLALRPSHAVSFASRGFGFGGHDHDEDD